MGAISGVDLAVTGAVGVERWRIWHKGTFEPYSACGLDGGMGRAPAVKDWWGWFTGVSRTAPFPGDDLSLVAGMGNGKGVTGTAKVSGLTIRGSVEKGGPVRYICEFAGNGLLTLGDAAATCSASVTIYNAMDMHILLDDAAEVDVREIELKFRMILKPYASTTVPGVTKRTNGVLDARVEWKLYNDTPSILAGLNATKEVKVRVAPADAPLYWTVSKCKVSALEEFGGEKLSEENMGGTMVAEADFSRAGTTLGLVTDPDGNTKFPFA